MKRIIRILDRGSQYPLQFENSKLFFGDTGYLIFLSNYYLVTEDQTVRKKISDIFYQYMLTLKSNSSIDDCSLCSGLTGVLWTFNWMSKLGFIKGFENYPIIHSYNEIIETSIVIDFKKKEYDLFYGLIGKSIYFFSDVKKYKKNIEQILNYVIEISENDNKGIYWLDYYTKDRLTHSNVESYGLSHGIPSIIIFLCKSFAVFPSVKLKNIIKSSVARMITIANYEKSWSYPDTSIQNIESRLAWCYGDLGVAYSFLIASKSLSDYSIFNEAKKIIIKTCERDINTSGIFVNTKGFKYDIGLCHGLAGVYLLYRTLSENINDPIISKKTAYYYEILVETLEEFIETNPPEFSVNKIDTSLFSGLSGPLLTLMSDLTKSNNSWKELMLII